jgi:hypothetical protein
MSIVEQHVLDGAERYGRNGCADVGHAGRGGDQKPRRQVDLFLRETVEMESVHARNMVAKIVAAFAAGAAEPAGACAVDRNELPRQESGDARSDSLDLAGCLCADDQRQLALGERHAAPAPDVDVVERNGLDAQRDLAERGRRRWREFHGLELAVFDELQCAHRCL